jgi:hypothetical protein
MIKELRLPSSITRFTIENHTGLTANNFSMGTYEYDTTLPYEQQKIGAGNGKYINDYSKIASLKVINTPIDTYEMVINAGNLEEYCLRDINWTITADNAQYCMRKNSSDLTPEQIRSYYIYNSTSKEYELWDKDTYPTGGVFLYEKVQMLNADKKVVSIPALDYLMTKNILDGTSHAEALTGTITIDIEGASAVELEIYQKYVDIYPDVKIKYGPKMSVEGANRVNFYYTEYTEGVDPEKLTPYFSVLTAKQESTLAQLVNTELFTPPSKTPTNYYEYIFTGCWYDVVSGKIYFQDNGNYNTPEDMIYDLFSFVRPNTDMHLFPIFQEGTRFYEVQLMRDDGS